MKNKGGIFIALMFLMISGLSFAQNKKEKEVSLSFLSGEEKIKIGQVAVLSMDHHASVGTTSDVYSEDTALKMFKSEVVYDTDYGDEPMPSGGDSAVKNYYFKADLPGTYYIVVKKMFRGKVEYENKIKVIVR